MSGTSFDQAVVVVAGRGELPFTMLHGVPLYVHALTTLSKLGELDLVVLADARDEGRVTREVARRGLVARVLTVPEWWGGVRSRPGVGVLVHDPLCPLAPTEWLGSVLALAADRPGVSVAAYRPVTDTVKTVVAETIGATIDREGLASVVAPVAIAATALDQAPSEPPPLDDLGALVGWLRARGPVELHRAPSSARRVEDASAVNLLEAVDELRRQVRHEDG